MIQGLRRGKGFQENPPEFRWLPVYPDSCGLIHLIDPSALGQ